MFLPDKLFALFVVAPLRQARLVHAEPRVIRPVAGFDVFTVVRVALDVPAAVLAPRRLLHPARMLTLDVLADEGFEERRLA
jgi:hypothetical protein